MTESRAAVNRQCVIIDFPGLDLSKLSKDYPNLYRFVSTGTAGLVKVPDSYHNQSNSLGLHIVSSSLPHDSILAITPGYLNLPEQHTSAIIIDTERYILSNEKHRDRFYPLPDAEDSMDFILKSFQHAQKKAPMVILTFNKLDKHAVEYCPQKIWRFYDNLIAHISAETNFNTSILMICLSRPRGKTLKNTAATLTPIVIKGHDFKNGILYSSSTRKKGIVTFNDLRHNIHKYLSPHVQSAFQIKKVPGAWTALAKSQHSLIENYSLRWPLLTGYVYLLIGVLFLFLVGIAGRFLHLWGYSLSWGYLYLLTLPAAFLLEAIADPLDWKSIALYTLMITGVLFGGSFLLAKKDLFQTLLWISLFTTGLVFIDGLFNGYCEYKSFLGYSVVAGARYYGIGNEYMGILLGSYIVAVSLALPKIRQWRREVLWFTMLTISVILIHPYFGADVGGGITALIGLGLTNYLWMNQKIRIKEFALLIILTLFVLSVAGIWDVCADPNSMSHFGQLILAIRTQGIQVFFDLAIRKMALNLQLIQTTPLTLVLIGTLLIIPVLYRFPPVSIQKYLANYPELMSGLTGLSITALIALAANDSGIVSAAMCFMFGIGLIISLVIKEQYAIYKLRTDFS
ncbi:MAG TPA: hypothetical protein VEC37_01850 [Bacillota bacterium]|nr:hypothetical protein [Bacillota bacterium]